jgi:mRNA-degrading endonuclease toxin of MazEF toxin-antitoxin module
MISLVLLDDAASLLDAGRPRPGSKATRSKSHWSGLPASVALADQVKSFDWPARRAKRKGRATSVELGEIRGKLRALIG